MVHEARQFMHPVQRDWRRLKGSGSRFPRLPLAFLAPLDERGPTTSKTRTHDLENED